MPEEEYHRAALRGCVMTSGMLREFQRCPAHYHALVSGLEERRSTDAFRFGRAAHKLLLEGEAAFAVSFAVGGPLNERTGRAFGPGSKAFDDWLRDNGMERDRVITDAEYDDLRRMRDAVRSHREASRLFDRGWCELSARADFIGVPCQARLDWLRPDGVAVDLKTIEDIGRFEQDARRFGYLRQFAFYRDVCRAAGGVEPDMVAVVAEKKAPFRAGVWRFAADVLEPYAVENRRALEAFGRCRRDNVWPTGYETAREFPLAGIPPLWLN